MVIIFSFSQKEKITKLRLPMKPHQGSNARFTKTYHKLINENQSEKKYCRIAFVY